MDWFRGLRAAVALCAPLVLGDVLGIPNLGWAALGGFEAILADTGGPYRSASTALSRFPSAVPPASFLAASPAAALYGPSPSPSSCVFFGVISPSSARPLPPPDYSSRSSSSAASAPRRHWHDALNWSTALFAGGVWASVLSLFLWPLDAYRPARLAVADCYTELASFLDSVYDLPRPSANPRTPRRPLASPRPAPSIPHPPRNRTRLASRRHRARRTLRPTRRAASSSSCSKRRPLIARTVALAEHLEARAVHIKATPHAFSVDLRSH